MPRVVRWYVRTALAHLVLAFAVGLPALAGPALGWSAWSWSLLPVFYHLLMVGWATQLILGVALWMFPVRTREQPRGDERLAWLGYACLNAGIGLRALSEPLLALRPGSGAGAALAAAGLLQVLAVALLALLLWPRVKGRAAERPAR